MASPFPGMDPYLEAPDIWPDFHDSLADHIRMDLNQVLPAPYYARLEMRPEVGIVEDGGVARRIIPDVAVARLPKENKANGGVAVLDLPRTQISKFFELRFQVEPIKHHFVEIRDPSRGHRLVTLIEIASPSNKRSGPDQQAYFKKQREILDSDASLIELDLLRSGQRLFANVELEQFVSRLEPPPNYLVMVHRAWQRLGACQIFAVLVEEPLPCIFVPLREDLAEVPLDLQFVMNRVYDGGPYRRGAVDYAKPPEPPLNPDKTAWLENCLAAIRKA
jgi:hypothetical protein